ncbi:hypothetical protein D3C76_1104920 [compost metagenome]
MEKDEDAARNYSELFVVFSDQIEIWLRRFVIVLVVSLCLFQAALRIPEIRYWLASAEKYEGTSIHRKNEP